MGTEKGRERSRVRGRESRQRVRQRNEARVSYPSSLSLLLVAFWAVCGYQALAGFLLPCLIFLFMQISLWVNFVWAQFFSATSLGPIFVWCIMGRFSAAWTILFIHFGPVSFSAFLFLLVDFFFRDLMLAEPGKVLLFNFM